MICQSFWQNSAKGFTYQKKKQKKKTEQNSLVVANPISVALTENPYVSLKDTWPEASEKKKEKRDTDGC